MIPNLIVLANASCGRGAQGLNLARFLTTYYGRKAVQVVAASKLHLLGSFSAERVFIGLPTGITNDDLECLSFREAYVFDYTDLSTPQWNESNREFLSGIASHYLKPWVEPGWRYDGLRLGVLPIRRLARLSLVLSVSKALRRFRPVTGLRPIDVAFLGNGTRYGGNRNPATREHQRVEWMRQLASESRLTFWGGLSVPAGLRETLTNQFGDLSRIWAKKGRVAFPRYFRQLCRSKVALCPTGNARWSYRHYEAIYSGAVPVSTDFRGIATLVPLPQENMIHVPDNDSVVPAIDRALAMREHRPEFASESIAFLEQYLDNGDYSRKRPALLHRFESQFQSNALVAAA